MIRLPDYRLPAGTFMGVECQHSPLALWTLELVLEDARPKAIVEIGTGSGAVTLFMAAWALKRGAQVASFDILDRFDRERSTVPVMRRLQFEFTVGDCFAPEIAARIAALAGEEKALLYCDGGNKAKELLTFAPAMQSGGVIGCHDYGTEVFTGQVDGEMEKLGFERYVDPAAMKALYTLQAWWRKK